MSNKVKNLIVRAMRKSQLIQEVARLILGQESVPSLQLSNVSSPARDSYEYLKYKFIQNGNSHPVNESERARIVERFEIIDAQVPMATTATDGLFLAELLLNMQAEGAIIECGCYSGGSTSKLSIIAKYLKRDLFVFDSFEGLPVTEQKYLRDQHCRRSDAWVTDWTAGRYAARLDEVKDNVNKFGELSVCRFVKGWFSETLTDENLPRQVAFTFTDVDLANSARDCFVSLWPSLSEGGIFVTHDTAYIKVLQEFYNPELWSKQFRAIPPILFGAGFGLCNDSPHIGYMVKGESLPPEYLKKLTIDK